MHSLRHPLAKFCHETVLDFLSISLNYGFFLEIYMHEVHEKSKINTNVLFTLLSHKFEKKSNLKNTS